MLVSTKKSLQPISDNVCHSGYYHVHSSWCGCANNHFSALFIPLHFLSLFDLRFSHYVRSCSFLIFFSACHSVEMQWQSVVLYLSSKPFTSYNNFAAFSNFIHHAFSWIFNEYIYNRVSCQTSIEYFNITQFCMFDTILSRDLQLQIISTNFCCLHIVHYMCQCQHIGNGGLNIFSYEHMSLARQRVAE